MGIGISLNALSQFPLRIILLLSRSVVVLLRYIGIPGVSSHAGAKIENEITEDHAQLCEKKLSGASTEKVN